MSSLKYSYMLNLLQLLLSACSEHVFFLSRCTEALLGRNLSLSLFINPVNTVTVRGRTIFNMYFSLDLFRALSHSHSTTQYHLSTTGVGVKGPAQGHLSGGYKDGVSAAGPGIIGLPLAPSMTIAACVWTVCG